MTLPNKVTLEMIESKIKDVQYFSPPGTTITLCILSLENGFTVTGESAYVNPSQFDKEIGEKIAKENAIEKMWLLEGYLLKEKLWIQEIRNTPSRLTEIVSKATTIVSEKEAYRKEEATPVSIKKEPVEEGRRTGRTTRIVDELIQTLFNTGTVWIYDHYFGENGLQEINTRVAVLARVLSRLENEHKGVRFTRQGFKIILGHQ